MTLQPGQMLSHYRLIEKIGAGGMGEVYRARDEHLDRDVAVKVLPAGMLADEAARRRFRREAKALSKLNHPNIQTVHDFDTQGGVDFLVTEYVPGVTLSDRLAAGSLPEKEVVGLGMQLTEGLVAAHEQSIVHRDLKPGNLRVTPDGRLKILDFGLAKLVRPVTATATTASLTETQAVAGTLPYMAPEQLRGEKADPRTDLYALGVVLYEMATGQRPFREELATTLADAILHRTPVTPRAVNDTVSPDLERIILKCLDKEPENRYQSAKELVVDLRRLGGPDTAPVVSNQSRWPWAGVAILSIAVVLALFFGYLQFWTSESPGRIYDPPEHSIAVLPFVNMSDDASNEYFSDGLSEELLNLLAQIPELRVTSRSSAFSFKGQNLDVPTMAAKLNVAHILEGSVRKSGNQLRITAQLIEVVTDTQLWSATYDRELKSVFAIQDEIAAAVVGALKITLLGDVPKTRKTDPQAYQLFLEGQYLRRHITTGSLQKAIEAFKQAVEIDPAYVPAWADLADTYVWLGACDLADQAIQTAIGTDPDYAYVYYARGILRIFCESRIKAGIEDFQYALELDPDNAFIVASIGKGAYVTGNFDLAIQQFQAGLRLEPVVPEFYFFLGMTYRGAGRLDDSEASFRKMLSLSPQYRSGHFNLWETLFLKGEFDAALAELEQLTSGSSKAIGLAITHYALGNEAQSDEILADLIEKADTTSVRGMAKVYGYRGEVDRAFEWLNRALETKVALVFILSDQAFSSLHSDPRWQPLLEKLNLLEYWLEMPPEWGGPQ